jgi:hypothetical protein
VSCLLEDLLQRLEVRVGRPYRIVTCRPSREVMEIRISPETIDRELAASASATSTSIALRQLQASPRYEPVPRPSASACDERSISPIGISS